MAWINGTATDYRDMLDQLIQIATSDHVSAVAIAGGGTGYSVDDILTITDGTATHAATLRVTSVSSGVITGIQVEQGGAYTVDPDLTATTAHTVAPSGGSGATFNLTMESEPWTVEMRAQEAVSATVASGGTGYTVGDDITVTMTGGGVLGATGYGVAPVFNVDSVSGGVVTAVSLVTSGHLEQTPDSSSGTGGKQATMSGGTGSGCVLTVTYQNVGASKEDVVILSGPGEGGTDQILCGFRTFQKADVTTFETVFNWQLFGMTEYNPALAMHAQSNISYGMVPATGVQQTDGGSFMVLKENDSDPDIEFWMSVTNRRIVLVCKVETATTTFYPSMYVGLLNPFATTAEEPYPLWIQGCTSRDNSWWGDTTIGRISGLSDMYAVNGKANGPAQYRADSGEWRSFANSLCTDTGSPSRASVNDYTSFPVGKPTYNPQANDNTTIDNSAGLRIENIIPTTGVPGTPTVLLRPTPGSVDDVRPLFPISPMITDNPTSPVRTVYAPFGELDNCYWLSASDPSTALVSEDVQKIGDVRYMVFQNGNQNQTFNYFCVKVE